jgi:acetyl-CoA synthetase
LEICARELSGLPDGKGLNIAYEAVDRHAQNHLKIQHFVLSKRPKYRDFTYSDLKTQSAKFANVLKKLKIGERVFSLTGRIPELYVTALGTLKYTAVFLSFICIWP